MYLYLYFVFVGALANFYAGFLIVEYLSTKNDDDAAPATTTPKNGIKTAEIERTTKNGTIYTANAAADGLTWENIEYLHKGRAEA